MAMELYTTYFISAPQSLHLLLLNAELVYESKFLASHDGPRNFIVNQFAALIEKSLCVEKNTFLGQKNEYFLRQKYTKVRMLL